MLKKTRAHPGDGRNQANHSGGNSSISLLREGWSCGRGARLVGLRVYLLVACGCAGNLRLDGLRIWVAYGQKLRFLVLLGMIGRGSKGHHRRQCDAWCHGRLSTGHRWHSAVVTVPRQGASHRSRESVSGWPLVIVAWWRARWLDRWRLRWWENPPFVVIILAKNRTPHGDSRTN